MKTFTTYLTFDGETREAMSFYQQCVGGDLMVQTFADAKFDAPGAENRVIHAQLHQGAALLMASDTMPGMPFSKGNNFSISINCESIEEADRLHAALSEGGKVTMPMDHAFWGAYFGMITDKFGVNWMFNHEIPKKD
ncbi:MAG TPA: VOC family protein [Gemmatimonadaceae bacterium]|nr:VOC family protein [Gemmatimonadaceae bacterium]